MVCSAKGKPLPEMVEIPTVRKTRKMMMQEPGSWALYTYRSGPRPRAPLRPPLCSCHLIKHRYVCRSPPSPASSKSPYSAKASWALAHHGIAYKRTIFKPFVSVPWLRCR